LEKLEDMRTIKKKVRFAESTSKFYEVKNQTHPEKIL
jgi:hypothetical protein